ncbi:MAG: hypothetical protein DRJ47_08075 [Thermoprotei archaeon]|nr:MAG: hypothetical protein DRJ47_08075 [Thermoprotei archaeon]
MVSSFLSEREGQLVIRIIRKALEDYLEKGRILVDYSNIPAKLNKRKGVFVGFEIIKDEEGIRTIIPRGRQGTPFPRESLIRTAVRAAISLAVRDPRYPPLTFENLSFLTIEFSVVNNIKKIEARNPEELLSKVEIDRKRGAKYGLILEKRLYREILLPQIIVENRWDAFTALSQLCFKAGLPLDEWKRGEVTIYAIEMQVFCELEPGGRVLERQLFFEE